MLFRLIVHLQSLGLTISRGKQCFTKITNAEENGQKKKR
jgi:hypothetical protein